MGLDKIVNKAVGAINRTRGDFGENELKLQDLYNRYKKGEAITPLLLLDYDISEKEWNQWKRLQELSGNISGFLEQFVDPLKKAVDSINGAPETDGSGDPNKAVASANSSNSGTESAVASTNPSNPGTGDVILKGIGAMQDIVGGIKGKNEAYENAVKADLDASAGKKAKAFKAGLEAAEKRAATMAGIMAGLEDPRLSFITGSQTEKTNIMAKSGTKLNKNREYIKQLHARKYLMGGMLSGLMGSIGGGGGGGAAGMLGGLMGSGGGGGAGGLMSSIGGGGGGGAGGLISGITNSITTPQEEGKYGNITKGMNAAYDKISDIAGNFGTVGKIVSGAMKLNALAGKGISKIGGGTDGMTKADAILGSSFMQMTPLGLINGFGGKKSHTLEDLTEDTNMLYGEQAMSGFAGSQDAIGKTKEFSNKKYGLFSSKARKKANKAIDKLNMQQQQIQDIAAAATDAFDIQTSMTKINNEAAAVDLSGGYRQGLVHVGKQGMKLDANIDYSCVFGNKGVDVYCDPDSSLEQIKWMKKGGKQETETHKIKVVDGGYIIFKGKLDKDQLEGRKPVGQKNGKLLYLNGDGIAVYSNPKSGSEQTAYLKEGGQMNVIPEGHLHARLHHMDVEENITKKGIPVIDNSGEQQAEIELNEIIFNKEITIKIEELWREGSDESAIECGKLLAEEIMENTDDRTGLIDSIE